MLKRQVLVGDLVSLGSFYNNKAVGNRIKADMAMKDKVENEAKWKTKAGFDYI